MAHGSPDTIKEQGRAHYGEAVRASTRSGCCTGRSHVRAEQLYGAEAIAELPDDLAAPSYGCGNPLAVADVKPGEHVLDLGSGAGLDVLLAARKVGAEGRVYGVDMTDDMLDVAQANARKAGARNVIFLKGDIESIPLPNESVDAIVSNCVVNLTPNKHAAFAEAFRVLKHGGRFAISDIVVDSDLDGLPLDEHQIRAGLTWAGCIAGALTTPDLRAILEATGFSSVRIDILSRYSRQRFKGAVPEAFAGLSDAVVDELMGRFASSLISAVKA